MIAPILFNYSEQPSVPMMADADAPPVQSLSDLMHHDTLSSNNTNSVAFGSSGPSSTSAGSPMSSHQNYHQQFQMNYTPDTNQNRASLMRTSPSPNSNIMLQQTPPSTYGATGASMYTNTMNYSTSTTTTTPPQSQTQQQSVNFYPTSSASPQTLVLFGFMPDKLDEILQHFRGLGHISSLQAPHNQNYCYLTFESPLAAQNALKWNVSMLCGCMIGVVPVDSLRLDMNRSPLNNNNNSFSNMHGAYRTAAATASPAAGAAANIAYVQRQQQQGHSSLAFNDINGSSNRSSIAAGFLSSSNLNTRHSSISERSPVTPTRPKANWTINTDTSTSVPGTAGKTQFRKLTVQTPDVTTPSRSQFQQQQQQSTQLRNMDAGIVQKNGLWSTISDTLFGW